MKEKIRKILVPIIYVVLAVILVLCGLYIFSSSTNGPIIDFLDVGQGDAILIRQGSQEMLIDGGQNRSVLAQLGQTMPFLDRRLEYVVVTHPHDDHTKGLIDILERYQVGSLILPKALFPDRGFDVLLDLAEVNDISVQLVTAGDIFSVSDSVLTVLWPADDCKEQVAALEFDNGEHDPTNICSLVMQYEYCDGEDCSRALLMADATGLSEEIMIKQGLITPASILKIGHHGSRFGTTSDFLRLVRPTDAVIQVGHNNFGHPDYGVILRLQASKAKVWRNDKNGGIRALPENGGFDVWSR